MRKKIDGQKKGKWYRIISKELDQAVSTVGNVIRKYKSFDYAVAIFQDVVDQLNYTKNIQSG